MVSLNDSITGELVLNQPSRVDRHDFICHAQEETVIDNTGRQLDLGGQFGRRIDRTGCAVEQVLTAVGDKRTPIAFNAKLRIESKTYKSLASLVVGELDNFDGKRQPRPELLDKFLGCRDDHKSIAGKRDELFMEKGTAAAFDEIELRRDLVGAINPKVKRFHVVEINEFNPDRTCEFGGSQRSRNAGAR